MMYEKIFERDNQYKLQYNLGKHRMCVEFDKKTYEHYQELAIKISNRGLFADELEKMMIFLSFAYGLKNNNSQSLCFFANLLNNREYLEEFDFIDIEKLSIIWGQINPNMNCLKMLRNLRFINLNIFQTARFYFLSKQNERRQSLLCQFA